MTAPHDQRKSPALRWRTAFQNRVAAGMRSSSPSARAEARPGSVAEWFKALVLKTSVGETPPWVRIPPLPPRPSDSVEKICLAYRFPHRCPAGVGAAGSARIIRNAEQAARAERRLMTAKCMVCPDAFGPLILVPCGGAPADDRMSRGKTSSPDLCGRIGFFRFRRSQWNGQQVESAAS